MNDLTRRELLAAFLGLSFATACGAGRRSPLDFDGTIAGDDDRLGHRLRAGYRPEPSLRSGTPVVIVGGGFAGLSAAWRLSHAGFDDYRVIELGSVPGGTSRGGANSITPFPWGAHYLPCPLPHATAVERLVIEAGAGERGTDGRLVFDEAQLCRAPQERLFVADRWYEGLYPHAGASTEELAEWDRFRREMTAFSRLRDGRGRRAFAVPLEHGSDDADLSSLDRISMAEWLARNGFRSRRLLWLVEYGCRDDYGTNLAGTSAWAGIHYHASRGDAGGVAESLLTWPDGNMHLVRHMAQRAGRRVETGSLVLSVTPREKGAAVLVFRPGENRAEEITAEHAVLAVPRMTAARMLPHPRLRAEARLFRSGAWLTANLTLRRRPASRGFPQAWDNVFFDSRSLGYVVATHQSDRHGGGPEATVWTWYLSLSEEDDVRAHRWLEALTWREAAEIVVADLRRAHPDIERCIERIDVWRWGHAMGRPRPGFVFCRERQDAARPLGDVHFAHSDLSGLPLLEEAQHHGIRAAEEILARRGIPFDSWL